MIGIDQGGKTWGILHSHRDLADQIQTRWFVGPGIDRPAAAVVVAVAIAPRRKKPSPR